MANKKNLVQFGASVQLDTSDFERSQRQLDRVTKNIDKSLGRSEKSVKDLEAAQRILSERLKAGTITQQQYNRELARFQSNAGRAERAYQRQTKQIERQNVALTKNKTLMAKGGAAIGAGARRGGAFIGGSVSGMVGGYLAQAGIREGIDAAMAKVQQQQDLQRDASMLGMSTKRLAELQYAYSRMLGMGSEEVTDAFKDLLERTSEAASDPNSAMAKDAAAMGLYQMDLQSLSRGNLPDLINRVVKELKSLDDEAEALFLSRSVFGDQAAEVLSAMATDTEAFDKYIENARKRQLVMPEQEYKDLKASTEEYRDSLENLNQSFVQFAPVIMGLANKLLDAGNYWAGRDMVNPKVYDDNFIGAPNMQAKGRNHFGQFDMSYDAEGVEADRKGYQYHNRIDMKPQANPYWNDKEAQADAREGTKAYKEYWQKLNSQASKPKWSYPPEIGGGGPSFDNVMPTSLKGGAAPSVSMGNYQVKKPPMPALPEPPAQAADGFDEPKFGSPDFLRGKIERVERDMAMVERERRELTEFWQEKFADEDERRSIGSSLGNGQAAGAGQEYEYLSKRRKAEQEYKENKKRDLQRNKTLNDIERNAAEQIEVLRAVKDAAEKSLINNGSVY